MAFCIGSLDLTMALSFCFFINSYVTASFPVLPVAPSTSFIETMLLSQLDFQVKGRSARRRSTSRAIKIR